MTVEGAAELLDLQLHVGDQRLGAGVYRQRARRSGLCLRRGGLGFKTRGALGQDQRMGAGEIGGQRGEAGWHAHDITMLRPPLPSPQNSSDRSWAPSGARVPPVDSRKKIAQLRR